MEEYWFLIDDIRDYNTDFVARTGQDGLALLRNTKGTLTHLMLDHDLGPDSTLDGYQVLTKAVEEDLLPEEIHLVTANPVGLLKFRDVLLHEGYHQVNPRVFIKE